MRSAAVLAVLTLGVARAAEPVVEVLGVDRIDADQDTRAEALDVRLVLQGTAPGTVVVRGLLLADGVPVSDRPSRAHALPTQAMLGPGPGPYDALLTLVHVGRGGQDQRPLRIDLDPGAPRESARD